MVSVEEAAHDTISHEAAIARDKLHHADEFLGSDLAAIMKDYDRLAALRALAGEEGR